MRFVFVFLAALVACGAAAPSPTRYAAPWPAGTKVALEIVTVRGDITEESAGKFAEDMRKVQATGQPIIPVEIDSYGGSVYAYLSMADTIARSPVPVATICIGKCMSAGALLVMQGAEGLRFATPRATLLIHDISSSLEGKVPDMREDLKSLEKMSRVVFTDAAAHIGKPAGYFLKMLKDAGHKDIYFTASQALEAGLVNKVGWPTFMVETRVIISVP
jgi:ATP-dependent Clp protease, protease subunit